MLTMAECFQGGYSMGMRCDQFIGLNGWAKKFLDDNAVKDHVEVFVNSVRESESYKQRTVPGKYTLCGLFDDEQNPLNGYLLEDGSTVFEKVYMAPWSSGPVIFTSLEAENGDDLPESNWSNDEIDGYL